MLAKFCLSCCVPCLLLVLAGCEDSGIPREAISGTVSLDGQPLQEGSILFTPLGEGPSVGGDIVSGRYELARNLGPSPGKYRVEISSWRPTGQHVHDDASGLKDETLISIIPKRYNQRSELEIEVQPGSENTFDFELASK